MRFIGLLCVLLSTTVLFTHTARGEDWYRFRGPRLDGISNEVDWPADTKLETRWRTTLGVGMSGVVTSGGRLYTMGNQDDVDTIHCIDANTGESIWKHTYESPTDPNEFTGGPTSTPTIGDDYVYTLSRRGDLLCIHKTTGKLRWQKNIADAAGVRIPGWGFAGSPLIQGDLVLVNVGDAGAAVNKSTGELVWSSADKEAGYSSLVPLTVARQDAVVLGSARSYVCVDVQSGNELWRQRWLVTFGCTAADPIVSDGHVFLSSGYNRGSALLKLGGETPTIVWKHKDMQTQLSSCVLIDGCLYGIHGDVDREPQLKCLDFMTGEIQWSNDSIEPGAISAAGNRLIILSQDGELIIATANPTTLKITTRHKALSGRCWTAPVLSNRRIYCRSADGELAAVALTP